MYTLSCEYLIHNLYLCKFTRNNTRLLLIHAGAINFPLSEWNSTFSEVLRICNSDILPTDSAEVSSNAPKSSLELQVLVICRRGNDSQVAVQRLWKAGVSWAVDIVGGLHSWANKIDPKMPIYWIAIHALPFIGISYGRNFCTMWVVCDQLMISRGLRIANQSNLHLNELQWILTIFVVRLISQRIMDPLKI